MLNDANLIFFFADIALLKEYYYTSKWDIYANNNI